MAGLPNIEVIFKSVAATVKTSPSGIVALVLKDTVPAINPIVMNSKDDIPQSGLTADNIAEIRRAFIGNVNPPEKVIAYVLAADATDYTAAMNYLETVKWNYGAIPGIQTVDTTSVMNWIKDCRDSKDLKVKMILPNASGDHEGIINFATDGIIAGANTFTAAEYCGRIAGILAGTPLSQSGTYAVLPEVTDVPHHTNLEFDALIEAGKLVLMQDGEKVKIARAVNSLVTITLGKNAEWQKIKIIGIMDRIYDDITKTVKDNYIGKFPNNYDNKCILITYINSYLQSLENLQFLQEGANSVGIDMDAQKEYLQSQGIDTSTMKDQDIKEANTGSKVFLTGSAQALDAMEDMALNLYV